MTITEVLTRVKKDRPGESSDAEMIRWLSQLDKRWVDEVILTHEIETDMGIPFTPETEDISQTGMTAEVKGQVTRVSGSYALESQVTVWEASVSLTKDRRYRLAFDVLGGSRELAEDELDNIFMTRDGTTLVLDTVTAPGSITTFTAPATDTYTFSLTAAGAGSVYNGWTTRVRVLRGVAWENFNEYSSADVSEELLIPSPDEEIYIHWLYAQIDYRLGEIERYNIDAQMFNTRWDAAAKRYNRQHMPLGNIIHHVAYGRPARWLGDEDPLNQRPRGW